MVAAIFPAAGQTEGKAPAGPFAGKWSWTSKDGKNSAVLEIDLYEKAASGIDGAECYGNFAFDDGAGDPDRNSITEVKIDGNTAEIIYVCSRSFDDVPAKGLLVWDPEKKTIAFTQEGYVEDDAQGGCQAEDVVFVKAD